MTPWILLTPVAVLAPIIIAIAVANWWDRRKRR